MVMIDMSKWTKPLIIIQTILRDNKLQCLSYLFVKIKPKDPYFFKVGKEKEIMSNVKNKIQQSQILQLIKQWIRKTIPHYQNMFQRNINNLSYLQLIQWDSIRTLWMEIKIVKGLLYLKDFKIKFINQDIHILKNIRFSKIKLNVNNWMWKH